MITKSQTAYTYTPANQISLFSNAWKTPENKAIIQLSKLISLTHKSRRNTRTGRLLYRTNLKVVARRAFWQLAKEWLLDFNKLSRLDDVKDFFHLTKKHYLKGGGREKGRKGGGRERGREEGRREGGKEEGRREREREEGRRERGKEEGREKEKRRNGGSGERRGREREIG